jgi:hypothetical protein
MADLDVAEDLGARADEHAAADLRVPVAPLLARAAERHVLEHGDVVLDHGGGAHHEARGVVEEDAPSDSRRRVDVGLEHLRRAALEVESVVLPPRGPQAVGEAVGLDGVEALEVEHRLHEPGAGGVSVGDGEDVGPDRLADGRVRGQRLVEGLDDELRRHGRVAEPGRHAVRHRRLEGAVVEHVGDDEARQGRLAATMASASSRRRAHARSITVDGTPSSRLMLAWLMASSPELRGLSAWHTSQTGRRSELP